MRAAETGEVVVLMRRGKPMAKLVPFSYNAAVSPLENLYISGIASPPEERESGWSEADFPRREFAEGVDSFINDLSTDVLG
jgi:antitoxin (DNA-binding transcriptional repressor) of toxin-antitoxin stability system